MMKENVFENPIEVRTAVASPHFGDRRVAQRAQPVVPLNEIRTRLRLRKLLYLGGAFAIAMVLGAASALLAVHIKRASNQVSQIELTNNTESETETTPEETATVDETAAVQAVNEPTPAVEELPAETEVEPVLDTPQKPEPTHKPRVAARDNAPMTSDRPGVEPSEEEQLEQIREAVLYERWQERRARRVSRRERRNRGDRDRGDRDLSQVDEIFEGPRRPDRP